MLLLIACHPQPQHLDNHIDGWEYVTKFKICPDQSLIVFEKRAKLIPGGNNVFVVEVESRPILKPNTSEPRDLRTYKFLFVELSSNDSIVTPARLGSSKIIREIIAMSPQYGVNELDQGESIEFRKLTSERWKVISDLADFQFEGEISFIDSLTITSKHKELINN